VTTNTRSVEITIDDDGTRRISITVEANGEEDMLKWTDNGTIPADILQQLEEKGIDPEIFDEHNNSSHDDHTQKGIQAKIRKESKDRVKSMQRQGRQQNEATLEDIQIIIEDEYQNTTPKRLSEAYIGIDLENTASGPTIKVVELNGPANQAGLRVGDVITQVNGARILQHVDLTDLMAFYRPKDKIKVEFLRDGEGMELAVYLGRRTRL
ncbi:MAG: S1C family serine protease, partial [Bacteroidota bacterium]